MVAVGGAVAAPVSGGQIVHALPELGDPAVEPREGGVAEALDPPRQRYVAVEDGFSLFLERRAAGGELGAAIRPVAAIDTGEDRLQAIIVRLRYRVELMIVTASAVGGQADEGRDRAGDHVVAVEQPGLELVDGSFTQLDVADEIPGAGGDEPGCDHSGRVARGEYVAGQLLANEATVGEVVVECADHVIAIRPRVVPALVLVVAVRVAVVDHVEPVPAPTLAEMRAGKQAVDEGLISVCARVAQESRRPPRESAADRSDRTRGAESRCGDPLRGWA